MSDDLQLPEGWSIHEDEVGRRFYANVATGESSWDPPPGSILPPPEPCPPPRAYPEAEGPPTDEEVQLVQAVRTWFMQTEMEQHFKDAEAFADRHCHVFDLSSMEHKLEYTELHHKFQNFFEEKLNLFLGTIGRTPEEFYIAFQKCAKTDDKADQMAEIMTIAMDYEFFCQIMAEKKRALGPPPPPPGPPP
eukprot:TRINITY_DN123786_c0_g1_i1.p1 TRINITY_DN123786_c0_g1~~TRINITY_DN123786_c0_g1_i1.p1  ORF type:complete len:191 (-),score=37.20 TRINITY_DN123786_c0_g1_i1:98-670(-)